MRLKRFYKTPENWEKQVDAKGNCSNPPPLDFVSVADTGVTPGQNFSPDFVADALQNKWLTIKDDTITLHVAPEDLRYKVLREPGRYCLHCGVKLPDDEKGALARIHIAAEHPDATSPDPANPAGYVKLNHYECVLDDAQHDRLRMKNPAKPPQFPLRKAAGSGKRAHATGGN